MQAANPPVPKTPLKQLKPITVKAKKATVSMLNSKKALLASKKATKKNQAALEVDLVGDEGGVADVQVNRRGRQITLPQRFK